MPAALPHNPATRFDLRRAFDDAINRAFDEGDDEGDDDDGDEGDDDGDDDDTGDDDEGDKGGDDKDKDKPTRPERQAAKYRVERNKAREENKTLQARIDELEAKIEGNEDKVRERKEREKEEALNSTVSRADQALFRAAFAEVQLEVGKFADPEYVQWLLEKDDSVEIDDGEVVGLSEAVEKLVKDKPELIAGSKKSTKKDDEDDDEDEDKPPSGAPRNKKKKKSGLDKEGMARKFPALANR